MSGETEASTIGEIDLRGPAGIGLRTRGYRLMDIAWIIVGAGVIWGAWELKAHAGDSEKQSAAIVKAINEANSAVVQSLKESNAHTVEALKAITAEQKKSTAAIREIACLNDPAMRNRSDAREFCRRMSRDER
jgi:hypothetical protein